MALTGNANANANAKDRTTVKILVFGIVLISANCIENELRKKKYTGNECDKVWQNLIKNSSFIHDLSMFMTLGKFSLL